MYRMVVERSNWAESREAIHTLQRRQDLSTNSERNVIGPCEKCDSHFSDFKDRFRLRINYI